MANSSVYVSKGFWNAANEKTTRGIPRESLKHESMEFQMPIISYHCFPETPMHLVKVPQKYADALRMYDVHGEQNNINVHCICPLSVDVIV